MIDAAPFSVAWFAREQPDGSRPVDPITTAWLSRLSRNLSSRRVAGGAAGIVSSSPLVDDGEFISAGSDDGEGRRSVAPCAHDHQVGLERTKTPPAIRLRSDGTALALRRDALGHASLFYQDNGQLLVISTELELLLTRPGWRCRLDRAAAGHYLAFGSPGIGRTLEAGTRALPAGHELDVGLVAGPFVRRHWSPLMVPGAKVLDASAERALQKELDDAIEAAADHDQFAMLLSGGIDSGYIAHLLGSRGLASRVDAYTVNFTSPHARNEHEAAAETARSAGISHHVVEMSASDAARRLPAVLGAVLPRSAWSSLTHAHLLEAISDDGRGVMLSGLGADEVFGGYSHYLRAYKRFGERLDAYDDDGFEQCLDDVLAQPDVAKATLFTGVPRFLDDEALQAACGLAIAGWSHIGDTIAFYRQAREIRPRAHLFELMIAHECQHRIPDLLLAGFGSDARAHGITVRYPFLNPGIVGRASRLGATERFGEVDGEWKNKIALRRIAATRLPAAVFARPPMTFGAPFLTWLTDEGFRGCLREMIYQADFPEDLIDRDWLITLFDAVVRQDPAASATPEADQLWIVITFLGWYRKWIADREMRA